MSFEEFQDGRPLGYRNGTILAILNLCVTVMPSSFSSGFGRRCRLKNLWRPSWISERNDFSNFESLYHCDASHEVSAQGLGGDVV